MSMPHSLLTRGYRKRYPHYKKERPHAIIGIENDTHHSKEGTPLPCTHRYRKRYPAHERKTPRINALPSSALLGIENDTHRTREKKSCINALPSSTLIGIENDTRHPSSGNVGSLMNLWYISLNSLNSLILQKKLQKTLVSRLSSLVFLLSLHLI